MLRHELVRSRLYVFHQLFFGIRLLEYLFKNIKGNLFVYSELRNVKVNVLCNIDHSASDDLDLALLHLSDSFTCRRGSHKLLYLNGNVRLVNSCGLDLHSALIIYELACLSHDLSGKRVYNVAGNGMSRKT